MPFSYHGIIQAFIARTYAFADITKMYKRGVLIEYNGISAIIEASENDEDMQGEILITIPKSGITTLFSIQKEFENIHRQGEVEQSVSLDGKVFVKLKDLEKKKEEKQVVAICGTIVNNLSDYLIFLQQESIKAVALSERNTEEEGNRGVRVPKKPVLKKATESIIPLEKKLPINKKILFLSASPTNESGLQVDKEHRIIKEEMRAGGHRDKFAFLPAEFAVTVTNLLRAMNGKPNIVHFSGHGLEEGIIITNQENSAQIIPLNALKRLFKKHQENVEIVFLNSCYSAKQAEEISKFDIFVIGHNLPIADPAAISFAKGFYNGLGEGKIFEDAYDDGMFVIETEYPNNAGIVEVWKNGKKMDL